MSELADNEDLDNNDLYNIDGKKKSERKEVNELPAEKKFKILNHENYLPDGKKKAPKCVEMNIKGLGWPVLEVSATGLPSVDGPTLKRLIGDIKNLKSGEIYKFYK